MLRFKCFCAFLCAAVDEQNAQTQQQLFPLNREDEEGLVEEEEEEETEEDKMSLQSSYSVKHRNTRRGQLCCCSSLASHFQRTVPADTHGHYYNQI